ncbi:MAG: phosphate acetyltransferase, partial [Muribaculaceae bacterium]|nr:phosphate acetyltransferase [Muribaculaceae bacterium]
MEQLFIDLEKKAIAMPQRLVLPESFEPRTLQAANLVIERGAAKVILIGDKNEIVAKAKELGFNNIENAQFINPANA